MSGDSGASGVATNSDPHGGGSEGRPISSGGGDEQQQSASGGCSNWPLPRMISGESAAGPNYAPQHPKEDVGNWALNLGLAPQESESQLQSNNLVSACAQCPCEDALDLGQLDTDTNATHFWLTQGDMQSKDAECMDTIYVVCVCGGGGEIGRAHV